MCRSIKPLLNFDPPATDQEIEQASLQFVRKISGFTKPSVVNEKVFNKAVEEISTNAKKLLELLEIRSKPKNRDIEKNKAKEKV